MTEETQDKYKMFRNFMVNELGVGRDDVRQWTQEAIHREVQKILGQLNVEGMVRTTIDTRVRDAIKGPSYNNGFSDALLKVVRDAIAQEISGRIQFRNPVVVEAKE